MKENITISMEEYKELLIIKGKYEELKSNYNPFIFKEPTLTRTIYDGEKTTLDSPYTVTWANYKKDEEDV